MNTEKVGHTPGPYTVSAKVTGASRSWYEINARPGFVIADVSADNESGQANANLIAAAPDLLEAGNDMDEAIGDAIHHGWDKEHCDRVARAVTRWRAVVARAEGE